MSDILQEAEKLLWGKSFTAQELEDKRFEMFPVLVAEIKRLRECLLKYGKKVMRQEASMLKVIARNREQRKQLTAKDTELARWQQIATDLKAAEIQNENSGDFVDARGNHIFQVIDLGKCRERAAEELDLQVTQESTR